MQLNAVNEKVYLMRDKNENIEMAQPKPKKK